MLGGVEVLQPVGGNSRLHASIGVGATPPFHALALSTPLLHTRRMTQKELVLDAISELPNDASLDEIADRVDFLAAIQKGFDQLDRGEGIPHDELKRELATWLTS